MWYQYVRTYLLRMIGYLLNSLKCLELVIDDTCPAVLKINFFQIRQCHLYGFYSYRWNRYMCTTPTKGNAHLGNIYDLCISFMFR